MFTFHAFLSPCADCHMQMDPQCLLATQPLHLCLFIIPQPKAVWSPAFIRHSTLLSGAGTKALGHSWIPSILLEWPAPIYPDSRFSTYNCLASCSDITAALMLQQTFLTGYWHYIRVDTNSGVLGEEFGGGSNPPPRNSKVLTKSNRIANWAESV
jgi:hypothetical protein